ncbi:MAG: M20/M25/M40 family metallo-hydrolase [Staphylococcus sp.]|nr:M20/M25/M40 family metallo-hydrolase [Staphylococcus sp.]
MMKQAVELLKEMIAIPSVSRSEEGTASLLFDRLSQRGASPKRFRNNVWALSDNFDPTRPTLMLNSHHDTVRPAASYTRDPHLPTIDDDGRLYGLGSNDAGASVVSLTEAFLSLRSEPFPFNLLLAITAEEEVGGENGMRAFLPMLADEGITIDCAIVGEPTGMQAAIAERGLVVLDCLTPGVTGHAARGEGVNAIYRAMDDINTLRNFRFPKTSAILGPIGLNITQINAGWQHNAIPDECKWVVDIRTTDAYTNEETVGLLRKAVSHTTLTPRSTRVRASVISLDHPLVRSAIALGSHTFVSPTTSDMSLMYDFPSLKIGPGQSSRSHSADEFVMIDEIEAAIVGYRRMLLSLEL